MIKRQWVIFLGIPLLFLFIMDSFPYEKSFTGKVEKVLDGDTVIVDGLKVRLYGIDAPESDQRAELGEKIGEWSQKHLEKLILEREVEVKWRVRGFYKRIIGEIFLDKVNINLKMLADGMATYRHKYTKNWIYYNTFYTARLKRAGIFGTFAFEAPWTYRKRKRHYATHR